MFEKLHDRLIQLAGLYQLMSVNERLSCNKEVFESVIKSSKFRKRENIVMTR
jgi:hypothetical protein